MVSFNVKSLFNNYRTIKLISKRIYGDAELQTTITKSKMKEIMLLCT